MAEPRKRNEYNCKKVSKLTDISVQLLVDIENGERP